MKQAQLAAHLYGSPKKELDVKLPVLLRPRHERLLNSLMYFAGCWLLAVPMFFVPVLHFVFVPFLLLAGPVAAYFASKNPGVLCETDLPCPDCGKNSHLQARGLKSPIYLICSHCGQHIAMEFKDYEA